MRCLTPPDKRVALAVALVVASALLRGKEALIEKHGCSAPALRGPTLLTTCSGSSSSLQRPLQITLPSRTIGRAAFFGDMNDDFSAKLLFQEAAAGASNDAPCFRAPFGNTRRNKTRK